jgi:hypothetical protein
MVIKRRGISVVSLQLWNHIWICERINVEKSSRATHFELNLLPRECCDVGQKLTEVRFATHERFQASCSCQLLILAIRTIECMSVSPQPTKKAFRSASHIFAKFGPSRFKSAIERASPSAVLNAGTLWMAKTKLAQFKVERYETLGAGCSCGFFHSLIPVLN